MESTGKIVINIFAGREKDGICHMKDLRKRAEGTALRSWEEEEWKH